MQDAEVQLCRRRQLARPNIGPTCDALQAGQNTSWRVQPIQALSMIKHKGDERPSVVIELELQLKDLSVDLETPWIWFSLIRVTTY